MSDVRALAAVGFGRAADLYERTRPSYPPEAVSLLVSELGLGADATVVDLAAGTGKLTRSLAATGALVVAVEPVAAMLAQLARAAAAEPIEPVAGTAEAIPLTDARADAVTVAQALHWFDLDRALPEIHRVLRPGGRLAILYNRNDQGQRLWVEIADIIDRYLGELRANRYDHALAGLDASPLFTAASNHEFPNQQLLSVDGVLERVGSASYVAALPDETRAQVLAKVRALVADLPEPIALRYRTTVHLYDRA